MEILCLGVYGLSQLSVLIHGFPCLHIAPVAAVFAGHILQFRMGKDGCLQMFCLLQRIDCRDLADDMLARLQGLDDEGNMVNGIGGNIYRVNIGFQHFFIFFKAENICDTFLG